MAGTVVVNFKLGGVDAVERAMRTVSQSAQRAATAQVRASQSSERAAQQSAAKQAREAERAAAAQIRASERAAAAEERNAARAAQARIKEEQRANREIERERQRANTRMIREQEAAARRVTSVGSGVGRAALTGAGQGFQRGTGILAAGAGLVTAGVGMSSVVNAIEKNRDLANRTALLQNSSGKKLDFTAIARNISNATGVDSGEVLGGFEKLAAKAGGAGISAFGDNIQQITANYMELAKVARGAGVSMTDLGDVTATLVNRGVEGKELVSTIESLVQQGKDGAVEFKDMATLLDSSSGALLRFKMATNERVMSAGGLTQMAKSFGRASAAEATTSVVDIARDLGGKADLVQALTGGGVTGAKVIGGKVVRTLGGGVEVGVEGTDRAQLRNINDLLPEIIEKASKAGNLGKIMGEGGIFTGTSTSIVAPLIQAFQGGIVKNKEGRFELAEGRKADMTGTEAVKAVLNQFSNAKMGEGESKKAFENVMQADKFGVAMNKFQNDLGEKLAPKMGELANATAKVADGFLRLVSFTTESPVTAAAAFVGLSTAIGTAQGALGKLSGNMLDKLFAKGPMNVSASVVNVSGAGVPSPAGGTPGGPGGASGAAKAMGALAALTVGAAVGTAVAETADSGTAAALRQRGGAAQELIAKLNSGTATAADKQAAIDMLGSVEGSATGSVLGRATSATAAARGQADRQWAQGDYLGAMGNTLLAETGLAAFMGAADKSQSGSDQALALALSEALKNSASESGKALTSALVNAELSVTVKNIKDIAGRNPTKDPIE